MKDETLLKAHKALDDWKKNITVDKFIEDHKRLGLVKQVDKLADNTFAYGIIIGVFISIIVGALVLWR